MGSAARGRSVDGRNRLAGAARRRARARRTRDSRDRRAEPRRLDRHRWRPGLHRRRERQPLPRIRSAYGPRVVARRPARERSCHATQLSRAIRAAIRRRSPPAAVDDSHIRSPMRSSRLRCRAPDDSAPHLIDRLVTTGLELDSFRGASPSAGSRRPTRARHGSRSRDRSWSWPARHTSSPSCAMRRS